MKFDQTSDSRFDVAIIGAGFCGTMTAVHLLAKNQPELSIALIEREDRFGAGVAYSTLEPGHLLNVPAGKMSALPDRPGHFLDWLCGHEVEWAAAGLVNIDAGTFVPRNLYGRYLKELLADAEEGSGRLTRIWEAAVDVQPLLGGALSITLQSGARLRVDKVVLALGVFPPGDPLLPDQSFQQNRGYLQTPWALETQALLAGAGDVLILGSGLTALDLLIVLQKRKVEGAIHVLSRHGLFPQRHRAAAPYPAFVDLTALPKTVRALTRMVRAEVAAAARQGFNWRAVVDSLRPFTQAIWQNFSLAERRCFLRHLRPVWESHRHRAAPEALSVRQELERSGRLRCHRGYLQAIQPAENDALDVTFRPIGEREPKRRRYRYVVNCTGPECNYHKLTDPLIVHLLARKLIVPDPLRLGLEVSPNGILNNGRGVAEQIFTLGSALKGRLLETTAVPELRLQARALAETIHVDFPASRLADLAATFEPDPAFAYEI